MTFVIEAGYNYYLYKVWKQFDVDPNGAVYITESGYGDDSNDFNYAYGGGQTYKFKSGYNISANDYNQ